MEESGENWPSDSDLEMGDDDNNNDYCYDDEEELGCDEEIQYFAEEEALDPIMDETQRKKKQRELEERLLALSATIPSSGFKNNKMDDRSILDNASNYVKQLQQRVRELEQEVGGGSNNNKGGGNNINLPEVKVRVLQNEVLIIIHCEKQKGLMLKILTKLENLHLSVLNNSVLPFGKSTLDITIVAQMGDRYSMTVKELVKTLRLTILTQ
ncbi:transcription factor bHLH19 isoform X2 [Arachis ipaensis]|uniref:Transcription factor n=1 Tax=Arachis hypogaea TaxID=3818 RepID=A0A6B9V2P2_ARAHY|nr:transcription factor bHLH19 isoform X2 [Arachis ipaensis]XP_025679473.1 transcription factor bHLH19 isoform X2 [Arachis hypogaea]QHN75610.1 Transcription factor [Arachis hypogaea]